MLAGLAASASAQDQRSAESSEYLIKAGYIFNFARLVEWPASSAAKGQPIVIGVLGNDAFATVLGRVVDGKKIDDRPFLVKRLKNKEFKDCGCRILFVAAAESARADEVIQFQQHRASADHRRGAGLRQAGRHHRPGPGRQQGPLHRERRRRDAGRAEHQLASADAGDGRSHGAVIRMNLRNLSIKRKLTLLAMLTSSIAVVLSSASFLIYDLVTFRNLLSQDLMTEAEIVAYNSAAAMAFNDEDVGQRPVVGPDGEVRSGGGRPLRSRRATSSPTTTVPARRLRTCRRRSKARATGSPASTWRCSTTSRFAASGSAPCFSSPTCSAGIRRARQYASILGIFVLVSGLIAWFVSSRLQGLVSGPILELEQTMRAVSVAKNYARARGAGPPATRPGA